MRVAICFWGLCRSTQYTIESLKRNLFGIFESADIDYDVYIHTYTLEGPYANARSGEMVTHLDCTQWNLLNPVAVMVEPQESVDALLNSSQYTLHGDPWADSTPPYQTFQNHLRALWSLHCVTSLWEKSSQSYDAVLYCRPDVRLMVPFKVKWLQELEEPIVMSPSFQMIDGWNDRFCLAKPKEASIWGHRFVRAHGYSLQKPLHSERFLADTMKSSNISAKLIRFPFRRIRADGNVCPADLDL